MSVVWWSSSCCRCLCHCARCRTTSYKQTPAETCGTAVHLWQCGGRLCRVHAVAAHRHVQARHGSEHGDLDQLIAFGRCLLSQPIALFPRHSRHPYANSVQLECDDGLTTNTECIVHRTYLPLTQHQDVRASPARCHRPRHGRPRPRKAFCLLDRSYLELGSALSNSWARTHRRAGHSCGSVRSWDFRNGPRKCMPYSLRHRLIALEMLPT